MRRLSRAVILVFLVVGMGFAQTGCAADGGGGGGGGGDGGPSGVDAGPGVDSGPGRDAGPPGDANMDCEGLTADAENVLRPVDIIWIVDSSSSMENDARVVQDNLDDFADFIAATGIDFHMVLVSDRGFVTPNPRFTSDPEHFLFVDRGVSSSAVFARALDQYPVYEPFLRADAITHMIGVTDDDDDMSGDAFVPMMEGLLGHPFTFHAIASEAVSSSIPFVPDIPCMRGISIPAAAIGERYYRAAELTTGLIFSICTDDWSGLFMTLAMTVAVSEAIPCVYDIPAAPTGMAFDRDRVNVEYTPDGAAPMSFPRAPDEGSCGMGNAWYYDDPASPTQILLCPTACTTVNTGAGSVDVRFGCDSILI